MVSAIDLGLVVEAGAIAVELAADDAPGVERVVGRAVDQVEQQPRALDVAEEAVADAGAFGGALDQAGDVGEHELAALVADNAELRPERRERIIANLGRRVADRIEEGRLAGIGQAEEADVGKQLQAQPDPHFLAGIAGLVLARGAVGRGLVAGVAAPAHAALEEGDALADLGEVGKQRAVLVIGEDLGADRNLDDEIVTAGAGSVRARPAFAAWGPEMLGVAEVDQRIEAGDCLENDIAALAAVAAVGAAELDEFLAAEADGTGAAGARADENLGLVEEMHVAAELGDERAKGNLDDANRSSLRYRDHSELFCG